MFIVSEAQFYPASPGKADDCVIKFPEPELLGLTIAAPVEPRSSWSSIYGPRTAPSAILAVRIFSIYYSLVGDSGFS